MKLTDPVRMADGESANRSPGVNYFLSLASHHHSKSQLLSSPDLSWAQPPPNPFSCLESLQRLDKNLGQPNFLFGQHSNLSDPSTVLSRYIVRHPADRPSSSAPTLSPCFEDEELCWKGSTLIWSKGTTIYRKFEYSHTNCHSGSAQGNINSPSQHIVQALFAYFDSPNLKPWANPNAPSLDGPLNTHFELDDLPQASAKSQGASSEINRSSFFHSIDPEPWSDNRSSQRSSQQARWKSTKPVVRGLCVLISEVLKIYLETGEEYTIAIPFPVEKIWPIERGVMMMKKSTSIRPRAYIPSQSLSPILLNKTKNRSKKTVLTQGSWQLSQRSRHPSDPFLLDSILTENETRMCSSLAGADLDDQPLADDEHLAENEADSSAELARYWAERKQMESSLLWTLSDPSTHYLQPVLTSEKIMLPQPPVTNRQPDSSTLPIHSDSKNQKTPKSHKSQRFCSALAPLAPLVTPPRRPGCVLSSGTVVYVADPNLDPIHPICITASTEGFTIFLCGRLPPNTSAASSGIIPPSTAPDDILAHSPPTQTFLPTQFEAFPNPPRSPTPPCAQSTQLRRSPRKLATAQKNTESGQVVNSKLPNEPHLSPPCPRTNPPHNRLSGLGHPSLRRVYSSRYPSTGPGPTLKKRGVNSSSLNPTNQVARGRRMSVVSNSSNSSFTFGNVGPATSIGLRKPSTARKSLVEQQLEMMSGAGVTQRGLNSSAMAVVDSGSTVNGLLDREFTGAGFDEWLHGMMDCEPSDRRGDGQLADEALDPEFVIQTLDTIEVPGRLTPEELPLIHAAIYDARGLKAYLAICIPTQSKVYIFRMIRTPDSIKLKSIGKTLEGTSIGPVLCTRPNVYDLFKFSESINEIQILSAESIPIHKFCYPVQDVKPSLGSYIELSFVPLPSKSEKHGLKVSNGRSDLSIWPSDPLVLKVFQVLSEEIGIKSMSIVLQKFIQLQRIIEEDTIKVLEMVLIAILTGEIVTEAKKEQRDEDEQSLFQHMLEDMKDIKMDPVLKGLKTFQELQPCQTFAADRFPIPKPPVSPRKRGKQNPSSNRQQGGVQPFTSEMKKSVMIGLGKVWADLKCFISSSKEFIKLGVLLVQLTSLLGWPDWTDQLRRSLAGVIEIPSMSINSSGLRVETPLMPDLVDHLSRIQAGLDSPHAKYFAISDQVEKNGFYGNQESCLKSKEIVCLYQLMFKSKTKNTALEVLKQIDRFGWSREQLNDLSLCISIPLKESLRICQSLAPTGLSSTCYELMDRIDLGLLALNNDQEDPDASESSGTKINPFDKSSSLIVNYSPPSISNLSAQITPPLPISHSILDFDTDSMLINQERRSNLGAAARFSDDMRIIDVAKMLNYSQEVQVRIDTSLIDSPMTEIVRQHSSFLTGLAKRTMALPFGGACFWYKTDPNIAASVPMIKLDVKLLPTGMIIQPDPVKLEPISWPRFHAGVAASLSLSVKPEIFDSSQISLGKPDELDDRHAGYLLGLGLNRHLKVINRVRIFRYLESKHDMTSIGVLLGMSAAFIGSGDPRVSSIIAAHVPAMHPTESIQLQVSPLTQSAGFISFGILHLATANRRLSDGMLKELTKTWRVLTDAPDACRESYTLCAGLGYGLVMLGKGTQSDTPAHKDLMRSFKSLIHGDGSHPLPGLNQPTMTIDVGVTSPAATLALALLYLKTGRSEAADLCEIPQTQIRLECIRPDLMMVRTLAKSLIMWNDVDAKLEWIEKSVPKTILEQVKAAENKSTKKNKLRSDVEMSYWSIISGAAFGLALKYAGSASAAVHSILLTLYDRLLKAVSGPVLSVQAKVRRHCLRTCHNVITLGLSVVMAGTGDLEVLRRLRVAHGNINEISSYGTHLVTHLALGLLFLGGGRYTLGTSDRAIASLICSMYPIFPSRTDDHVHHLQALRHFWVLAVEPRCLIARDVERRQDLIFLPVKLKIQESDSARILSDPNDQKAKEEGQVMNTSIEQNDKETKLGDGLTTKLLTAPTLIPELNRIRSIKVESPRYWPLRLELEHHSTDPRKKKSLERFYQNLNLWVKRRVGHLSYSQDPKGTKSLTSRGRSSEEVTVCQIDDFGSRSRQIRLAMRLTFLSDTSEEEMATVRCEDLNELLDGFDLDEQSIGLVNYLCWLPKKLVDRTQELDQEDLSAYSSTVLLQCLFEDKLDVFPSYLAIFARGSSPDDQRSRLIADRYWELKSLNQFYQERGSLVMGENKNIGGSGNLIDRRLMLKVDQKIKETSKRWSETLKGEQIIRDYFNSDCSNWPSSANPDDEYNLATWLKVFHVPNRTSLICLKKIMKEIIHKSNSTTDSAHHQKMMIQIWFDRLFSHKLEDEFIDRFSKLL